MAKRNGNWKIYLSVIIFVLSVGGSFIYSYAVQGGSIEDNAKHIDKNEIDAAEDVAALKKDGCDPSEEANDEILVVKTEIKYIKKGIDDLKTDQKAMQTTILKAIQTIKEE